MKPTAELYGSREGTSRGGPQASPKPSALLGPVHSPSDLDIVMCWLRHQEFPRDLHLSRLSREIAQEPTFFFYEEEFGKLLGFGLKDFDPLFQFRDQIVKLHGSWDTEVKICR